MFPILVVVGAVAAIMPQEWYDRMSTIETYEQDTSAMSRINAWWTAYNLAKDRVTGGGFDTFHARRYLILYAPDPTSTPDVHSIYFEIMGEHGFIGFTMFMLLAWFTWNTGNRIRRLAKDKRGNQDGALIWPAWSGQYDWLCRSGCLSGARVF